MNFYQFVLVTFFSLEKKVAERSYGALLEHCTHASGMYPAHQ